MELKFNSDFAFGAATSSYQIEGAAFADGKGVSIWDEFVKEPGKILEGHTGEVACDHYHRWKEDVALLAELGVQAYRFSLSWTRILPEGTGKVNPKGIEFYNDLINELLKYNITPYVTLYHWDYPNALELRGGWLNPESPKRFQEYTRVVAEAFGDRVKHFITFNEPQIFLWLGYDKGSHAPGLHYSEKRLLTMTRHVALAHGLAVQELRRQILDARVGYAPTCGAAYYPYEETEVNIRKARKLTNGLEKDDWLYSSSFWNELILKGRYHLKCTELFGESLPKLTKEESDLIGQKLDFCGMNLYQGCSVSIAEDGWLTLGKQPVGHAKTGMGWSVTPKAMYWAVKNFYEEYQIPLYITENGMSSLDVISEDGKVHDPARIVYLSEYLEQLQRAIQDGADVKGYFQWSFLDNFEWEKGYTDRFGLVYVDYESQKRIPKDSFTWYSELIKRQKHLQE
ncbi:MAG: GH1 family beta-glucosidase [Lachnospiraceae bacterium]|nr:GH1 family beta-glucosidase [Lachnospiraceae bacterium]